MGMDLILFFKRLYVFPLNLIFRADAVMRVNASKCNLDFAKYCRYSFISMESDDFEKPLVDEAELRLEFQDTEWKCDYIDHDRQIARAIVFDDSGCFYFVRAVRDDDFGKATLIETSGGGVERGEELATAVVRELQEELGISVDVVCKIGVVSDYYNLIHRHNINNYFLCKVSSFGEKHLTEDEIEQFHLSTLKMTFEEAVKEYEKRSDSKLGRLIAQRELPILHRAREIIEAIG